MSREKIDYRKIADDIAKDIQERYPDFYKHNYGWLTEDCFDYNHEYLPTIYFKVNDGMTISQIADYVIGVGLDYYSDSDIENLDL